MATAKFEKVQVVKPVDEERVVLTLTLPEARALWLVLGAIGGDPDRTARKYLSEISNALHTSTPEIRFDRDPYAAVNSYEGNGLYLKESSLSLVEGE